MVDAPGERDDNARLWFSGTACYAFAASIFSLSYNQEIALLWSIVYILNILSILLMIESLRREIADTPVPWTIYLTILLPAVAVILFTSIFLDSQNIARSIYLTYLSLCEMWLIFLARRVKRNWNSRALDVVISVFAAFALLNLLRAIGGAISGQTSHVLSLTPMANIAVVMNFLGVVFYSFGYWGFALEKTRHKAEESSRQLMEANVREQESRYKAVLAAEREQLLMRMVRLGRLAQSGALSASIAHEISQPMSATRFNLELAIAGLKDSPESTNAKRFLERAVKANVHASEIIHRIRNMFQANAPAKTSLVVDTTVSRVLDLLRKDQRYRDVRIEVGLNAETPVFAAEGELEHVLINLLNNAVDSITAAGSAEKVIRIATEQQGGITRIRISDSGGGIPVELRNTLFDIAVSTKPDGMGMGLWLARYIVERNLGRLYLDEDQTLPGACFVIEIGGDTTAP